MSETTSSIRQILAEKKRQVQEFATKHQEEITSFVILGGLLSVSYSLGSVRGRAKCRKGYKILSGDVHVKEGQEDLLKINFANGTCQLLKWINEE